MATGSLPEVTALVAGARAAAVHELLQALLRPPIRLPHTPPRTFLVVRGPWVRGPSSGADLGSASGLFDHGTGDRARLAGRVRRVEVSLDDPLLAAVTLVAVRAVGAQDADGRRLACELVERCGALVLVTDGRFPYQPAEIDLMRSAVARGRSVMLAVTRGEGGTWAEVVRTNQATLAHTVPELALRPWYCVTRSRSGVPDLREDIGAWARQARHRLARPAGAALPAAVPAALPATLPAAMPAALPVTSQAVPRRAPVRVAPDAAGSGWADLVVTELSRARHTVARRVDLELARVREVVAGTVSASGAGPAQRLSVALGDLSVALAGQVEAAVDAAVGILLTRILAEPPDARVVARVRSALRADVAERCAVSAGVSPAPYPGFRVLRVTTTGAATVGTSRVPAPALAGFGDAVLAPLGIELTRNCLPKARTAHTGPTSGERDWVDRAVAAVAVELDQELDSQFAYLRTAVAELVAESLDHDLLLV